MRLRDAKILFENLRRDVWRIIPTLHVLFDHQERKFTADVIIALIQGRGRLVDNKMPSAVGNSLKFEPLDSTPYEVVLVISAYRKVNPNVA